MKLQSSDDEALEEEEELAKQMQKERAKLYTEEDFDLVGWKVSVAYFLLLCGLV